MLYSSSPLESFSRKRGMSCLPCILSVNWLMLASTAIWNDLGEDGPPGYTLCSISTSAPDSEDCELYKNKIALSSVPHRLISPKYDTHVLIYHFPPLYIEYPIQFYPEKIVHELYIPP